MFEYACEILRVIDGDTVVARIDLGFHVSVVEHIRLAFINTPEIRGGTPEEKQRGFAAKDHLTALIEAGKPITVKTMKDKQGKFGRYLGSLYNRDKRDINNQMVDDGYAVYQ